MSILNPRTKCIHSEAEYRCSIQKSWDITDYSVVYSLQNLEGEHYVTTNKINKKTKIEHESGWRASMLSYSLLRYRQCRSLYHSFYHSGVENTSYTEINLSIYSGVENTSYTESEAPRKMFRSLTMCFLTKAVAMARYSTHNTTHLRQNSRLGQTVLARKAIGTIFVMGGRHAP